MQRKFHDIAQKRVHRSVYTSTLQSLMAGLVTRRSELRKVKFGTSDMHVSELCVGSMTWGSYISDEAAAHAQLDAAFAAGANFIDTAELYPVAFNYGKLTEVWIGNWLAKRVAAGTTVRKDYYMATKCNAAMIGGHPEGEEHKHHHGYEVDILERSCRASIERLQCEYIDLYQLHFPSRDTPVFGCASFYPGVKDNPNRPFPATDELPPHVPGYEVFERQVLAIKTLFDKGLIKHWGLSNENAYGITMFCVTADKLGVPRPISCQNDFSLLNRTYECDTWEAAYRFGVVGLPYGALAGGVLTGKYIDGSKWSKAADADRPLAESRMRKTPEFQPRYGMPMAMLATAKYVALAEKYGVSPTELALAWSRQRACNTAIISGTCTVAQMEQCIAAFKVELPEECMTEVDVLAEQFRHPCSHMHSKKACLDAPWLTGDDGRHASQPHKE